MIPRFRAKLLAIGGEPHDIILHTKTDSTEFDIIISQSQLELVYEQMVAMRKKIQQEPA